MGHGSVSLVPLRFSAAVTALACGLGAPVPADACDSSAIDAVFAAQEVPLSGPIVVDLYCNGVAFCEQETPTVRVTRAGAQVAGSTEIVRGRESVFVIFRPAAALSDGASYAVEVGLAGSGAVGSTVKASASARAEVPTPEQVEVHLSVSARPVEPRYCCGGVEECWPVCVAEHQRVEATLSAGQGLTEEPFALYRLRYKDDAGAEQETAWQRHSLQVSFAEPAAAYCATLEVMNLTNGTIAQRDVCLSSAESSQIGKLVAYEFPRENLARDCYTPPSAPGLQTPQPIVDLWCEAWIERCQRAFDEQCELAELEAHCGDTSSGRDGSVDMGPASEAEGGAKDRRDKGACARSRPAT
jgi:hypothetical protein